jgi:predicted permease
MPFRDFGRDLRLAVRSLAAAPAFAAGVIASLTLGIAANTAAFSFVNAAVFRPFPGVGDQHELVRVGVTRRVERFASDTSSTYEEYGRLRAALPGLADLAAHHRAELALTVRGESSAVPGALVSANYFDVLGVRPAAGRFFVPEESSASIPVAVIAHATWRRHFSEDPAAVGQTLMVNGVAMTIVGVAPSRFSGIEKGRYDLAVWIPFGMSHLVLRDAARRPVSITSAGDLPLTYVGRRGPDATLERIQAQAAAAGLQIDALRPSDRRGTTAWAGRVWLNDPASMAAAIVGFMAVPLLVLVIACVNAANLLFARASRQSRDWQVRLALGASRWRIVRQVLAESVLLAAASCAAGLLLTSWGLKLVGSSVPVPVPLDARVQLFTIAAAAATAIAFGVGPAVHVASRGAVDARRLSTGAGTARSRLRFGLIAAQAALSLGLLATGAQFVNTVRAGSGRSVVEDSERLLLASFNLEPFNMPRAAADDFYARLLDRTAAISGVVSAGMTSGGPLAGNPDAIRLWLPDESAGAGRRAVAAFVSGDYFRTARAPVVEGRTFTSADRAGAVRAAIVSQAFAKRYFGGRALDRSMRVAFGGGGTYASGIDLTVVGVVGAVPGERGEGLPLVFTPAPLADAPARWLYVRFDDSGRFTPGALQSAVREIDYRVPIRQAATLRERRARTDEEAPLIANGVAALGLFALVLAAGGLYGVVSYIVALRRREIGVRLALGATRRSVVRLVVGQALVPVLLGAIAGAGGAAAIGAIVRSRLYGAAPVDPLAFCGAAGLLIATMAVAGAIPARHAAKVDPMVVLRED